jgi:hypothetical protein
VQFIFEFLLFKCILLPNAVIRVKRSAFLQSLLTAMTVTLVPSVGNLKSLPYKLSRLRLLSALSGVVIVAIAITLSYLWHRTTTLPNPVRSQQTRLGVDLGKQSCDNFDRVRLKISKSKQRETAFLNTEDVNTLFACRLYHGLGEQPGSVLRTRVELSRKLRLEAGAQSTVRAEATIDLAKVPTKIEAYRVGSYGPTALSTIILKLRKIPVLGSQRLFFAVEGSPIIRERNFIFYNQPQIQIGQWQFAFKQASRLLRIYPPFIQESLSKEYGSLPMEPHSIFVEKNSLELQLNGSKTAW